MPESEPVPEPEPEPESWKADSEGTQGYDGEGSDDGSELEYESDPGWCVSRGHRYCNDCPSDSSSDLDAACKCGNFAGVELSWTASVEDEGAEVWPTLPAHHAHNNCFAH